MRLNEPVVQWLLEPEDPSVRFFALTELLEISPRSPEAQASRNAIPSGPQVRALLRGQQRDGGFGIHPYGKWTGAHWRLVSLVELGLPAGHARAVAAAEQVLQWLSSEPHRQKIKKINGLVRQHASMEGNALAVCSGLGLAGDPRVAGLARSLVDWQWPDGGWNCDKNPRASHSSFYESLATLWGLIEYHRATRDGASRKAAERAAEFFLKHRLFRSETSGKVIDPEWLRLHYPLYWRYDVLQALRILSLLGKATDPRAKDALDVIEARRRPNGRWRPGGYYWRRPGQAGSNVEVVDWGRGGPNKMLTLNALRVLKAAGRLGDQ